MKKDKFAVVAVYDATRNVRIGNYWLKYLFDTNSRVALVRDTETHIKPTIFDDVTTDKEESEYPTV